MCSIGTPLSGKILAVIQLSVEILPWFYGQKDKGTKLFYFSTKAPYHWDDSHPYKNNSSVVKNLEAYKKSVWTNHLWARVERSGTESLPLLCSCPCPYWHCTPLLPSLCRIPCREASKWPEQSSSPRPCPAHPLPYQSGSKVGAAGFLSGPSHQCYAHSRSWAFPKHRLQRKRKVKSTLPCCFTRNQS